MEMNFCSISFNSYWKLWPEKILHNPVEVIVSSCAFPAKNKMHQRENYQELLK